MGIYFHVLNAAHFNQNKAFSQKREKIAYYCNILNYANIKMQFMTPLSQYHRYLKTDLTNVVLITLVLTKHGYNNITTVNLWKFTMKVSFINKEDYVSLLMF